MAATKSRSKSSQSSQKGRGRQSGDNGQSTAARFASKAKGPALAGGAALVGLAGGAALNHSRNNRGLRGRTTKLRSKVPSRMPSMPKPDAAVRTVGNVAGEVARRSGRIGQIASEVQKASEAIDGRSKG